MPVRLCVHIPDDAAVVRLLDDDASAQLGRDDGCDVVVLHPSVSRRHALLRSDGAGWMIEDLGSKNGIRVDGQRIERHRLGRHCWFALGDVYCEFELLAESQREVLAQRAERRRFSSRVWVERIEAAGSGEQLLAQLLTAVVELAECQRGFLMVGDDSGDMVLRACYNLQRQDMESAAFVGSRGALDRALRERRLVLMTSADDQAWLQQRDSVAALGLRSLVCLPLEHDGELVGAVYADSNMLGRVFTTLDAQLLRAFAEQAALALAAARVDGRLAALSDCLSLADGDGG